MTVLEPEQPATETAAAETIDQSHTDGNSVTKQVNSSAAVVAPAGTTTSQTDDAKKENKEIPSSARKKWWRLPSLPVLKILQGIFLLLMIGQNVPGPHKKLWPFNGAPALDTSSTPVTPYYVEQRSDLYGHERQFPATNQGDGGGFMRLLLGANQPPASIPSNTGIPEQQNIVLTLVNREYESYRYSVQAATMSKVQAARQFGQVSFHRAIEKVLSRLTDRQDWQRLTKLEEKFLEEGGALLDKLASLRALLVDINASHELEQCNSTNATSRFPFDLVPLQELQCEGTNNTMTVSPPRNSNETDTNSTLSLIQTTNYMLSARVSSFFEEITNSLPPGPAHGIRDALIGHYANFGFLLVEELRKSPMRLHFSARKKRLFVTHFWGDVWATAVSTLRKEVTAIVRSAEPGDEALVVLQSGGGTVTGYGLVAAQLLRIKEAGLKLTIAVEEMAASGGYMAACTGHTVVCSPFAVVGSIGVVQEMPNLHERLRREGVEFFEITAGEYKRVLSPTKEATPKDLKKAKEDLEVVWNLFKEFVAEQRPALNMDVVATGEVWYGKRAVEVGLCDAIQAPDNVLTDFVDRGYDVYRVKYEEPVEDMIEKFWKQIGSASIGKGNNTLGLLLRTFLRKIVSLLQVQLGGGSNYESSESWDRILLV